MTAQDRVGASELVEIALADLAVRAPSTVAPAVLEAVGLADAYAPMDSPIGPVFVAWNGIGVSAVTGIEDAHAFEERFRHQTDRPAHRAPAVPPTLAEAIRRRLDGDRRAQVRLDLRRRTEFERAVWLKALEIPRGEVRPYAWIAAEIGRPAAVRAVGSALASNPVPLVVPCHRVVRSDGLIGEYSLGGPANKRAMLEAEGLDPDELERLARSGIRYVGSDTTRVYCFPSCHNARRIGPDHRVPFRSPLKASEAGYRACRECRPPAAGTAA